MDKVRTQHADNDLQADDQEQRHNTENLSPIQPFAWCSASPEKFEHLSLRITIHDEFEILQITILGSQKSPAEELGVGSQSGYYGKTET